MSWGVGICCLDAELGIGGLGTWNYPFLSMFMGLESGDGWWRTMHTCVGKCIHALRSAYKRFEEGRRKMRCEYISRIDTHEIDVVPPCLLAFTCLLSHSQVPDQ